MNAGRLGSSAQRAMEVGFICGARPAPQGLRNSAQGFNPGKPQNKRFALKGREMRYQMKLAPIAAQKVRVRKKASAQGVSFHGPLGRKPRPAELEMPKHSGLKGHESIAQALAGL